MRRCPGLLTLSSDNIERKLAGLADTVGMAPADARHVLRASPQLALYATPTVAAKLGALRRGMGMREEDALAILKVREMRDMRGMGEMREMRDGVQGGG